MGIGLTNNDYYVFGTTEKLLFVVNIGRKGSYYGLIVDSLIVV